MTQKEFTTKLVNFRLSGKPVNFINREFPDMEEAFHYISELRKARNGEKSIYFGKVIHNETDNIFAIVDSTCYFKYGNDQFNEVFSEIEKYNNLSSLKKFTQPEIALICFYKSEPITEGNKEEKGKKYICGSGSKLAENYDLFKSECNRIPNEPKKMEMQLKRFEKIIPELSGESKTNAEKDYNRLKINYSIKNSSM